MHSLELGQSIPPDTSHFVHLPAWKANVGYEEGESWITNKMTINILALAEDLAFQFVLSGQKAMLLPPCSARRCLAFMKKHTETSTADKISFLDFGLHTSKDVSPLLCSLVPTVSAIVYSPEVFPVAKQYGQHTGDGVSSRCAEFCHGLLKRVSLPASSGPGLPRGGSARDLGAAPKTQESMRFLEERFGHNLDLSLVEWAKSVITRRIAGAMAADMEASTSSLPSMGDNLGNHKDLQESDVYLSNVKSINFGSSYVDALKILQKFGPGCLFYGHASEEGLDGLEKRLETDLANIRSLAGRYDFTIDLEDICWPEDIVSMERDNRDFTSRIKRINTKLRHSAIGLLSVTFHQKAHAITFFDTIETAKGPSPGTNFTLTSPHVLLAHYQELDWATELGVNPDPIRVSVGLEEADELRKVFPQALEVAEKTKAVSRSAHK
ncbi:hypothetical protein LX36DRAFT_689963 [Colletotrichum falcatum]|nr:hypothetical protein LX36DRAFT_689963 [Colletotrichum falcatum]